MSMVKNAFPYPGGKSQYAHRIIRLFPAHLCYVEAFGGGGSVLLQKPPSRSEVYNDLNSDVVTFFRVVRERRADLETYLTNLPYAREVFVDTMDRWYDQDVRPDDEIQHAAEFLLLRVAGHGSIFGRTGFSASKENSVPKTFRHHVGKLDAVADRFREVAIENRDYSAITKKYDGSGTFFYFDPPYLHLDRDDIYAENPDAFGHEAFAAHLADLEGRWAVSYSDVPDALREVADTIIQWDQTWVMAKGKDADLDATESLVLNYDPDTTPAFTDARQNEAEW